MKYLAFIITGALIAVHYVLITSLLAFVPNDTSPAWIVPMIFSYAFFMIWSSGTLFEQFPEPLQKYFRNKTPDNPDGCG